MASLQESLSKFKKQQEKCQSTLTSIAAKSGSSRASTSQKATPINAASPAIAKSPAPPVKFSNDTERLQHINSIRKGPVGAQIKRVIDLLLEVPISFSLFVWFLLSFLENKLLCVREWMLSSWMFGCFFLILLMSMGNWWSTVCGGIWDYPLLVLLFLPVCFLFMSYLYKKNQVNAVVD